MHIHLPKPLHGWREFLGEIGIIVIGVLLALSAEQAIESWRWHEKVDAARKSIDFEVNQQLDFSEEVMRFQPCVDPFVSALESAILRHDAAVIARLYNGQSPFFPRPWRSTAWQSAMSTGVADHFRQQDLNEYAFMFTSFDDLSRTHDLMLSDLSEATTGRLGAPADPASTQLQLAAAERLRVHLELQGLIADSLVKIGAGQSPNGWKFTGRHRDAGFFNYIRGEKAECERTANAPQAASKG
jgi:hypothetical protein